MTASKWEFFSVEELRCKCGCGKADMNDEFMQKVVSLRKELGFPFIVTSAFRCKAHDMKIGPQYSDPRPHVMGRALDLHVYGQRAHALLKAALANGFTGIGAAQKGDRKSRFIHLDNVIAETRPWVWTYA